MLRTWTHFEPGDLSLRVPAALTRAAVGSWALDEASVGDFRTWLYWSLLLIWRCREPFAGSINQGTKTIEFFDLKNDGWRSDWHRASATALGKTLLSLSENHTPTSSNFFTTSGGPAVPMDDGGGDVGTWPMVIMRVAGYAALTFAACYLGEQAMPVLDRALTRSNEAAKMASAHTGLLAAVELHNQREVALGGAPLPPNAMEQAALDALLIAQKAFTESKVPPAPAPVPPPPITQSIGSTFRLAMVAGALLGAFYVFGRKS